MATRVILSDMTPVSLCENTQPDKKAIACNYVEGISECAQGALCYIRRPNGGNAGERIEILARSRSGRWIIKWESTHRLGNFRLKTIPAEHPRYNDERFALCAYVAEYAREDAAAWWNARAETLRRERLAKEE
jgi:hypothetical protein